ncbi:MAG: hypothetical protein MI922_22845 [Bacteroidales bacterium]|nr:hypothetical protein [Bacteroidales bacterium]
MKRLNWIFFVALTLITSVAIVSCEKDTLSEEEALKLQSELDTVQNLSEYTIDYSVVLVDASSTTLLKSAEKAATFGGAVVTIAQKDSTWTETVKDASDMAYFSGLRFGYASVNIVANGYSEVNYTIYLDESGVSMSQSSQNNNYSYEIKRMQTSNIIPMLPIGSTTGTATISGVVTYDTDLTNTAPENAGSVTVLAMVDISGSPIFDRVEDDVNEGGDIIQQFSYGGVSMTAVTDATTGAYSISVPAANNGIEYDIIVPRFTKTQTVFDKWTTDTMFYSKTVTAAFGVGTDNNVGTTPVPTVSPLAMVTFSEPDYSYTDAQLDVVIHDDKDIGSAIVVDAGDGNYLKNRTLSYTVENTNSTAPNSDLVLNLYTNDQGYIYRANVADGGMEFDNAFVNSNITVQYENFGGRAIATFNDADNDNIIDDGELSMTQFGHYYIDDETKFTINRTGAATNAPDIQLDALVNAGSYYYINANDITINDGGTGVANNTTFEFVPNIPDNTKAIVDVEFKGGIVSAITVTNGGANYVSSGTVEVEITDNTGKDAKATATVDNGVVKYITVSPNGEGYSSSTTARIINTFEPKVAKATATVSGTRVTGISLTDAGAGYYADPTVSIIPGIGGYTPTIVATATAEYHEGDNDVDNVEVDVKGLGYRGNIPSSAHGPTLNNNSDFSVYVTAGATYEAHIYLGTGRKVPGSEDYEY